jgi:signal transduction histidine kinase
VLTELGEAVEPPIREKALEFVVDAGDELPPLFTDRTKLKQILLNLLSNAVKFTSKGEVRIAAARDGRDHVRIAVQDTGIGIKPEDVEKIFDDFRQVDQSPTREYGGTGLGLSITRKLIALLNGDIEVSSTYGRGSEFIVRLPVRLNPGTREEQLQRALTPDLPHATHARGRNGRAD